MDKSENTTKLRYINEYKKMGEVFKYKPSRTKGPWDKVLLQIFVSLIILSVILLVNTVKLSFAKGIVGGVKKSLNWQIDLPRIQLALKDFNLLEHKGDIKEITTHEKEGLDHKTLNFVMPLDGEVTSPFGERVHPVFNTVKVHYGIDIEGSFGDIIRSSIDGYVSEVGEDETYGKYIRIINENYETLYAHCSKTLVKEGEEVKQGEEIAEVGDTGLSSGPHLHFEIRVDGEAVDPLEVIN